MKLRLKKKIEKVMNDKLEKGANLNQRYRESVKSYDDPVVLGRYNEQGYKDAITEKLKEVSDEYEGSKVLARQKIEAAIDDAKKAIEEEMNAKKTHTADYNIRINNAYLALNSIPGQLDDDTLYMILGDIVEDNTQMHIVKKMVENKIGMLVDANGNSKYSKTFGHLMKYEAAIEKISKIEKVAKYLFTKADDQGFMVVGGEAHGNGFVGGVRFSTLKPKDIIIPSELEFMDDVDSLDKFLATEEELIELAVEEAADNDAE